MEGNLNEEQLLEWAKGKSQAVLFYSSAAPGERREVRAASSGSAGEVAGEIEAFFARLARKGAERGFTRMIVAGGETSGAVTKGLGYDSFYIGTEIAPGVPMMIPCGTINAATEKASTAFPASTPRTVCSSFNFFFPMFKTSLSFVL